MKKVAIAILITGIFSLFISDFFQTQFQTFTLVTAAAVCYLGLGLFQAKGAES